MNYSSSDDVKSIPQLGQNLSLPETVEPQLLHVLACAVSSAGIALPQSGQNLSLSEISWPQVF